MENRITFEPILLNYVFDLPGWQLRKHASSNFMAVRREHIDPIPEYGYDTGGFICARIQAISEANPSAHMDLWDWFLDSFLDGVGSCFTIPEVFLFTTTPPGYSGGLLYSQQRTFIPSRLLQHGGAAR